MTVHVTSDFNSALLYAVFCKARSHHAEEGAERSFKANLGTGVTMCSCGCQLNFAS